MNGRLFSHMIVESGANQENQQLEMWANARRDGRPAEYRWRALFNAAKLG